MATIDPRTTTLIAHADRGIIIGKADGTLEYVQGKARRINTLAGLLHRRPVYVGGDATKVKITDSGMPASTEDVDLKVESIPLGDFEAHYEIVCGWGARTNTWVIATDSAPQPNTGTSP